MASHINDLDLDSALLLYIAGELTNGDKAAIERKIADDPKLAQQVEEMRKAMDWCVEAMRRDDQTLRMPTGESVAVRRAARAMQQWQVNRVMTEVAPRRRTLLALPWWSYASAAVAACLVIGFIAWSFQSNGKQLPAPSPNAQFAENDQVDTPTTAPAQTVASATELADWMDSSFGVSDTPSTTDVTAIPPMPEESPTLLPTLPATLLDSQETLQ